MVLSTFTSISVLWDERVIQQWNYFLETEQEICGLSGKGAQASLGVSRACSSFLVKAQALKVNLSVGSLAAPWQNNEQLCVMWRRTRQKLTLQCGRRRRYQSSVTLWRLKVFKSCQSRCTEVCRAEMHGCFCLLWRLSHSLLKNSQWNCFPFTWGDKVVFFSLIVESGRA